MLIVLFYRFYRTGKTQLLCICYLNDENLCSDDYSFVALYWVLLEAQKIIQIIKLLFQPHIYTLIA